MSASVAVSPSLLKSALPHVEQQFPARQAKKASMSASVAGEPSPSKSGEPQQWIEGRRAKRFEHWPFTETKLPLITNPSPHAFMSNTPSPMVGAATDPKVRHEAPS